MRVFPGNTADPTAFTTIVDAVKDTFKLTDMAVSYTHLTLPTILRV